MTDNITAQESWNMATETLKRLSRCLDICSFCSQQGDLFGWYQATFDLRRNLSPFLTATELEEINSEIMKFPKQFMYKNEVIPTCRQPVYIILDKLYILFVKHMKEKGLLMPKSINPSAAVIDT